MKTDHALAPAAAPRRPTDEDFALLQKQLSAADGGEGRPDRVQPTEPAAKQTYTEMMRRRTETRNYMRDLAVAYAVDLALGDSAMALLEALRRREHRQ
jgi:hypothetical protein